MNDEQLQTALDRWQEEPDCAPGPYTWAQWADRGIASTDLAGDHCPILTVTDVRHCTTAEQVAEACDRAWAESLEALLAEDLAALDARPKCRWCGAPYDQENRLSENCVVEAQDDA